MPFGHGWSWFARSSSQTDFRWNLFSSKPSRDSPAVLRPIESRNRTPPLRILRPIELRSASLRSSSGRSSIVDWSSSRTTSRSTFGRIESAGIVPSKTEIRDWLGKWTIRKRRLRPIAAVRRIGDEPYPSRRTKCGVVARSGRGRTNAERFRNGVAPGRHRRATRRIHRIRA